MTPFRPTSCFNASNWGFRRTTKGRPGSRCFAACGMTLAADMKDTSITTIPIPPASRKLERIAGVLSLYDYNSGVLPQAVVHLAAADVHGVDSPGASLQQAVGKAAGGGAHVQRFQALHVQCENIQGVGELNSPSADERQPALDLQRRVRR